MYVCAHITVPYRTAVSPVSLRTMGAVEFFVYQKQCTVYREYKNVSWFAEAPIAIRRRNKLLRKNSVVVSSTKIHFR